MAAREITAPLTRFGEFVKDNGVKVAELSRLVGVSEPHLYRLRRGLTEPTRPVMIWLTLGCRRMLQREVLITELFDFGDEQP